jgi:hypothetical protein
MSTSGKLQRQVQATIGVPGLWPEITPGDLGDAERVCAFIAEQRPWWTPGTMTGYHALTWGSSWVSWFGVRPAAP